MKNILSFQGFKSIDFALDFAWNLSNKYTLPMCFVDVFNISSLSDTYNKYTPISTPQELEYLIKKYSERKFIVCLGFGTNYLLYNDWKYLLEQVRGFVIFADETEIKI